MNGGGNTMLTGDLLRFVRRKGVIEPRLVEPTDEALLEMAQGLIDLVGGSVGRRRGEIEERLTEAAGIGAEGPGSPSAKVTQGLAKLLLDRCEFSAPQAAEPRALRQMLFDESARAWRTESLDNLTQWRERAIAKAAQAFDLSADEVEAGMYGDLAENQRLTAFRRLTSEGLLYRYNVAQVQGLLLRAEGLELYTPPAPPKRMRQWLRYLQFFGLLFRVEPQEGGGMLLRLDGPLSLLESSSRYGMNLAQFFPVLLLWQEGWRLEANLTPKPGRPSGMLRLSPHPRLKSHYPDQGQWMPEALVQFQDRFNSRQKEWKAEAAEVMLPLPGNQCLVPDLVLTPNGGGEVVYLEFLPYPIVERVAGRLDLIDCYGKGDYLLACRGVPALGRLVDHPALHTYRRTLLPDPLLKWLSENCTQVGGSSTTKRR